MTDPAARDRGRLVRRFRDCLGTARSGQWSAKPPSRIVVTGRPQRARLLERLAASLDVHHIVDDNHLSHRWVMPATALVQARIDPVTRDEAAVVLAAMGMTVPQAVRLLLTRIAEDRALPFSPLVPNETTIAAKRE